MHLFRFARRKSYLAEDRRSEAEKRLAVVKSYDQVAVEMGNSPRKVREDYSDPKPEAEGIAYFNLLAPTASENVVARPLGLEFR